MGVRFECPAGHKLHVKTELAGKRGICPECGAKFIVPSFSGERVAEDNGDPPPSKGGARGGIIVAGPQDLPLTSNKKAGCRDDDFSLNLANPPV